MLLAKVLQNLNMFSIISEISHLIPKFLTVNIESSASKDKIMCDDVRK